MAHMSVAKSGGGAGSPTGDDFFHRNPPHILFNMYETLKYSVNNNMEKNWEEGFRNCHLVNHLHNFAT